MLGVLAAAVALAGEAPPLPKIGAPLPVSATSHPFSAANHQKRPFDLAAQGYVEREYLVSGQARVFDWPDAAGLEVLGQGPYVTRILVRRPKDARRFNGTVIVEPLNPSEDVDLPIMWAESYRQLIRDGYAWVGVTIKPNTIKALKRFDPERYAAVSMANPRGGQACAASGINAWSQPTTPADETGLAWDMLSQIGALLKSRSPANPMPWSVERLYMTGQSQTAGYARTYATAFAGRERAATGGRLYDGYLYSGSPPWQVPLNQCRKDLEPGDPRRLTSAAGAPVIELFTQGDMATNVETRRPDADTPTDRFRRYEVAGAPHVDPWEGRSFASDADMARAGARDNSAVELTCQPAGVEPTDFPNRYVFDAAWRSLDRWVRLGVPAPHAQRLEVKAEVRPFRPEASFDTDADGNAKGGVRTPAVDVPTARWIGSKTGPFVCLFQGYKYPFGRDRLTALYPTHAAYVAKVRADTSRLVALRWLTPEDAAEIVQDAQKDRAR
jgi:hypothetical protein